MGCGDEQNTPVHSGFIVGKFERFFAKDLSSSLKTFINFVTLLQNNEKFFEGLREAFLKKFPFYMIFH